MPSISADRRQVNANLRHSSATRLRALSGHARLSALTLAALATGYHPDGSAPEPGFPKTDFAGVLPAWPSCLRLSTIRADRSFCRSTGDPEPPGGGLAFPRAGTAPRFRPSGLPFRKGALNERGDWVCNYNGDKCQGECLLCGDYFPVATGLLCNSCICPLGACVHKDRRVRFTSPKPTLDTCLRPASEGPFEPGKKCTPSASRSSMACRAESFK